MTKNTLTTNLEAKKNKKKSVKKEVNKQFTNKNIDKILQEKMKTLALAVQIFNSDQIYDRSEIFKKYIENSGISISSIKYSPNKKYIALCLYTCISWGSPRIYYDYDYPYDEESMIYLINIDNLQYIPKMYCKTHGINGIKNHVKEIIYVNNAGTISYKDEGNNQCIADEEINNDSIEDFDIKINKIIKEYILKQNIYINKIENIIKIFTILMTNKS